jgi:hypothetical protein
MNLPLTKALIRIKEVESILEANKHRGMEVCGEVAENGEPFYKRRGTAQISHQPRIFGEVRGRQPMIARRKLVRPWRGWRHGLEVAFSCAAAPEPIARFTVIDGGAK